LQANIALESLNHFADTGGTLWIVVQIAHTKMSNGALRMIDMSQNPVIWPVDYDVVLHFCLLRGFPHVKEGRNNINTTREERAGSDDSIRII
jgi:hypothetical protein